MKSMDLSNLNKTNSFFGSFNVNLKFEINKKEKKKKIIQSYLHI